MSNARKLADNLPIGGQIGTGRNVIHNGAMNVAQRSTSITGVTSGVNYAVDRFPFTLNGMGTWTLTQQSDGPDGFANSVKIDCTTANASPSAHNYAFFYHKIEGQYLQQLGYGTSSAQSMVLSFYVKSNKTGNGSVSFYQADNSFKHQSHQYTINAANTWERKSIIVQPDTSGVINDDNDRGFEIEWMLNAGTDFTTGAHQSTWTTLSNTNRNPSNLGIGGSTSDYWQITGIQLEVGDTKATPFEHEPVGFTLSKCQRYYYDPNYKNSGTLDGNMFLIEAFGSGGIGSFCFPVTMRAAPSVSIFGRKNAEAGKIRNTRTGAYVGGSAAATNIGTTGFGFVIGLSGAVATDEVYDLTYIADAEM